MRVAIGHTGFGIIQYFELAPGFGRLRQIT
jgi:hypothetical protein